MTLPVRPAGVSGWLWQGQDKLAERLSFAAFLYVLLVFKSAVATEKCPLIAWSKSPFLKLSHQPNPFAKQFVMFVE